MSHSIDYSRCGCKIGRDIDTYSLSNLNQDLLYQYHDEDASLRDLASYVNRRILNAALTEAEEDVFDSDQELFGALDRDDAIAAIYEALATDDVPAERQARVRTQLEQSGIDLDAIMDDWVTHPTVRSHLRECLDVDTSPSSDIDLADATNTIQWARSRCEGVVKKVLQRLEANTPLGIASPEVSVSVRITCTECHESYQPSELTTMDRCACTRVDSDTESVESP